MKFRTLQYLNLYFSAWGRLTDTEHCGGECVLNKKAAAESAFIPSCCLSRMDRTSSATSYKRHCKGTLHHRSTRSLRPELWHLGTKARTQVPMTSGAIMTLYILGYHHVLVNPLQSFIHATDAKLYAIHVMLIGIKSPLFGKEVKVDWTWMNAVWLWGFLWSLRYTLWSRPVQRLAADILTGSAELCQTVTVCLKCTDGSIKAAQRASVVKVSGT